MTQPGLLHHFPSKEHLLLAMLEERYHADGRVLTGHSSEVGLALFDALLDIVEHNQSSPESVKLFTVLVAESIAAEHPAHGHFVERYRKIRDRMARDLRVGQATGEIRDDVDVDLLAPVIVGVLDGLQNQWLLDGNIDMHASFRLFCDLLGRGLRADEGVAGRRSPDPVPNSPAP
jgi:AcrR family transcriptional regulator